MLKKFFGFSVFLISVILISPKVAPSHDLSTALGQDEVQQILTDIRKLPSHYYYDMHGNAAEPIKSLMNARFRATQDLIREIEKRKGPELYLASLFDILAFVKDPSSIRGIQAVLHSAKAHFVWEYWLPRWDTHPFFVRNEDLKWLEGKDAWANFFREEINSAKDSRPRLALLRILAQWFHDEETVKFFEDMEQSLSTTDAEFILIETYLNQHGYSIDASRLKAAIKNLQKSHRYQQFLIEAADRIRHEAFVPFLISVHDRKVEEHSEASLFSPQRDLEQITFVSNLSTKKEWQNWYDRHKNESRDIWAKTAMLTFTEMMRKDRKQATEYFSRSVYSWDDIPLLPYMEDLAKYTELQSDLIGWINLTYHPYLRQTLQPLANEIIDQSWERLENWAQEILLGLRFVGTDNSTWVEYVEAENSHI